jgi:hypothetical protein
MRRWLGRRRRDAAVGKVGTNPPTGVADGLPAADTSVEPRPADLPQNAVREAAPPVPPDPSDRPVPVMDPTAALASESLDRALERLRARIPARDDDASR